jgi:mRNA interferase RelE/StbE
MTYAIRFHAKLEDDLAVIPLNRRKTVLAMIDCLADEPRPSGVKKLSGVKYGSESVYRIRVGTYRVCYCILDGELVITVIAAAKREDIYRILKRRLR